MLRGRAHSLYLFPLTVLAAAWSACVQPTGILFDSNVDSGAPEGATFSAPTGLPCDVSKFLVANCLECHGASPVGNSVSLTSFDELTALSSDGSNTVAELSLARMADVKKPMPPTGLLAASVQVPFKSWVTAGAAQGTCDEVITPPSDIYATETVCTSKTNWTRGDHGSGSMHPGQACTACHAREGEGPRYAIAGTVYPTAHEPDDCNGSNGAAISVIITDANGKEYALRPNTVGNFAARGTFALPYTARVESNGKTRVMVASQTNGDCNVCHSEQGSQKAPGRIMAP